jgi:hypothetical protein
MNLEARILFLLRLKILTFTLLFCSVTVHAASFEKAGFQITVEPIVAYEFTQVNTPTIHTRGMLMYGGRVTAGHKLISGEGEFTLGSTNETFPGLDKNVKTDKQNARLGIRSAIGVLPLIDFLLRLGGQASKTKTDTTTISTVTTLTSDSGWQIHPYAGTGIQVNVASVFSLALEATYLFRSVKDWSQNDVQTSVSFKIHLPSK